MTICPSSAAWLRYERLYFQVHEHAITGVEVIGFCRHLLRHVPGKLLVLWDGAPIHRCRAVKQFLHEEAGDSLHLERFPGYAPELDLQEGIWRHLKHVELRNACCTSLAETRKSCAAPASDFGRSLASFGPASHMLAWFSFQRADQ